MNISFYYQKKYTLVIVFLVFNVLFPKCGVKIYDLPITLGFLVLFIGILFNFYRLFFKNTINLLFLAILVGLIYWWIILSPPVLLDYDYLCNESMSYFITPSRVIAYICALVFLPLTFFLTILYVNVFNIFFVVKILHKLIVLTMIYSVLQFIFGVANVQIPGVTVNYSDYINSPCDWIYLKVNGMATGGVKIPSTYQNGNLYGANLLLFFPLIYMIPKSSKIHNLFLIILFLFCCWISGGRTIYIGAGIFILWELYSFAIITIRKRTIKRNEIVVCIIIILLFISVIPLIYSYTSEYVDRLLITLNWDVFIDGTGRIPRINNYLSWLIESPDFITSLFFGGYGKEFNGGAYEVLYFSIFMLGGLIGLLLLILPILYLLARIYHNSDWLSKGLKKGITIYLIISMIDGCYWLIPTALNLWMMLAFCYIAGSCIYREKHSVNS